MGADYTKRAFRPQHDHYEYDDRLEPDADRPWYHPEHGGHIQEWDTEGRTDDELADAYERMALWREHQAYIDEPPALTNRGMCLVGAQRLWSKREEVINGR